MKCFYNTFFNITGLSEKADILLKKRASNLSVDENGATPLHYAAHNNHAVKSLSNLTATLLLYVSKMI